MSTPCKTWMQTFVGSVTQARHYQRKFFKTKDPATLDSAKAYERIVDKMLSEWDTATAAEKEKMMNPTLF